jgi:hypothetical protein
VRPSLRRDHRRDGLHGMPRTFHSMLPIRPDPEPLRSPLPSCYRYTTIDLWNGTNFLKANSPECSPGFQAIVMRARTRNVPAMRNPTSMGGETVFCICPCHKVGRRREIRQRVNGQPQYQKVSPATDASESRRPLSLAANASAPHEAWERAEAWREEDREADQTAAWLSDDGRAALAREAAGRF